MFILGPVCGSPVKGGTVDQGERGRGKGGGSLAGGVGRDEGETDEEGRVIG